MPGAAIQRMAETDYDVIIVGSGPVGGHLGRHLAEAGLSVLMLEEHVEIGKPFQCAGLVNPGAMAKVDLHQSVLTEVWGARIHSPEGLVVDIGQPERVRTYVVCRKLFDEACVRQAVDAGATLRLASRPIDAQLVDGAMEVRIARNVDGHGEPFEEVLRCRLLCGADGAHSWTRRHFRMGRPKEFMIGFQAEVTGYPGAPGQLDMFTGRMISPGFFAWAIPNGETHRIGVWARPEDLDGRSCEDLYDSLRAHPLWQDRFSEVRETARFCGPIASGMLKRIHKERLMLFGDAAGLCKPTTGGGIGPGFEAIHLMKTKLIEAIRDDRMDAKTLGKIAAPVEKIRKDQDRARVLRDIFLTDCDDTTLENSFANFVKPEVTDLINQLGEIERPVPLGIRLLKDVPAFRKMAAKATWALLTS